MSGPPWQKLRTLPVIGKAADTKGGKLLDIEGTPRSPINQGTLCPKVPPAAGSCSPPGG